MENYAKNPSIAKKCLEFVMDTYGSLKRKRKSLESVWNECQDAYRTIEKKSYFQSNFSYCSNDLRDSILTIVPKYAKAIWYQDIPFELIPEGEDGDDEELAEVNQKVLAYDFRNLRVYLKYVDYMFQKSIYGTGIVKTPLHFEEITKNLRKWHETPYAGQKSKKGKQTLKREKKTERMFMGTDFIPVDIMNFWIDPMTVARGSKDAVECGDTIEELTCRLTDLDGMQKRGIYTNIRDIEDYYIGSKAGKDTSRKQRMKRAGHIDSETSSGLSKARAEGANRNYELKECYADFDFRGNGIERCLITVGAEKTCLRVQPWGEKPYLTSRHTPNGYNKEFYGTGLIETNLSNHYERNATRKQVIAARTMGLNMELFSSQNGLKNRSDRLRTAPNKVHFVKDINGVKPFDKPIGQILQSAIAHETNLKSETQQSVGNTPYVSGNDVSRINDTAHGIAQLTQAGNERFSLPLQVDEAEMLEMFVKRCLQNRVDHTNDAFTLRLTDKKPIKVRPEDLSASFDVYAKGASELQNKQLRQAGLLKAWEIALGSLQLEVQLYGQPLTNFAKLKEEIFANLGISQPEEFLVDLEEAQGQKPQIMTPDMEWVLLQRMRDGVVPVMPLMIQPGEDYKDHYEQHKAKTTEEEFEQMPEELKQIWYAHLMSYDPVLKHVELKKKPTEDVDMKEVAVDG